MNETLKQFRFSDTRFVMTTVINKLYVITV